jgi:hypothetical protein
MKSEKIYQIILMTFFGMLGSVLIGFIFFNTSIFIPTRTNFQFVAAGFIGALFFSLLEYESLREQIFGMLFILILNLIIFTGKAISISYLVRDVFYLGGLFLSIKLYYQFIKKNPKIKYYLRNLALAFIYGLLNIVCGSIILFINSDWNFPTTSFIYFLAKYGVLIGFGIGLGIDFYYQNKKYLNSLLKIK